ncbi:MAG: M1 family peptidase [Alphaproteobacteria bacterium]|nr:MAG: M1 family peptidase [Alphaproteobacteria bacterium]
MSAKKYLLSTFSVILFAILAACSAPEEAANEMDEFTFANYDAIVVRHVDLDLDVDFDNKILTGSAELSLEILKPDTNTLILDTRDLAIKAVFTEASGGWQETGFVLEDGGNLMGQSLTIDLPEGAAKVRIEYQTSPGASGLQWLTPEQTAGKEYPFMFSQSQAIHARSWVPIQDTPAVRFTYSATIRTPEALLALMSADQDPYTPRDGEYSFEMPQAIPAYLMAIAVGDLEFQAISDTVGVYAEEYILAAAAEEFSETPMMMEATEALYGPYLWGRYDLLILPPSFPFGGMENPRLTFLTPTVIAGDKSLTSIIAHELAHSWSGNLVTNATWRHAWLNEGFTSYVENRVMEEVYGKDRAVMEQVLGKADLLETIAGFEDPAMSALVMPYGLNDPFEGFTDVPYQKGDLFLRYLEQKFGREKFDTFLRAYFEEFAFGSILSEDFYSYLDENLMSPNPGVVEPEVIRAWIYDPGLLDVAPEPTSDAFTLVSETRAAFLAGEISATELGSEAWITHQWLYFINALPDDMAMELFIDLDTTFDLSVTANAEIAFAWYMKSLQAGYLTVVNPVEEYLIRIGRGKLIYPLYQRLVDLNQRDWALKVYQKARPGYHPIAQARIDAILEL